MKNKPKTKREMELNPLFDADGATIQTDWVFIQCDRCGWNNVAYGDFCCGCGRSLPSLRQTPNTALTGTDEGGVQ